MEYKCSESEGFRSFFKLIKIKYLAVNDKKIKLAKFENQKKTIILL